MSWTALGVRKQAGGTYVAQDAGMTTGTCFFVHSGTGVDNAGNGRNPDAPLATLAYALAAATSPCTANKGDIVYVMPGHAETISAAAGIVVGVAGIKVVGLGWGRLRPTITFDTDAGTDIDIDAANVTFENLIFSANFADIAVAIDVNADDFTMRGCRFVATATDMNFLICVQDAAAGGSDRITIEDCYHLDRDATNTHFVNFAGTGDGHVIRNNVLMGDYGTMAIGGAGIVTNVVVADNVISNASATADSCINLAATTTGIVVRNLCAGAAAQANGITATACTIAENYYGVVSEDLSAILDPGVT